MDEHELRHMQQPFREATSGSAFSCPLPPPEDWLRVTIRAGEAT